MQNIRLKRFLKKTVSWIGLFFFVIAAVMLYIQLSKYQISDIKKALTDIPLINISGACAASFLGYIALSSYDFLALKYIGRTLAPWKWMFAGFVGFSVSNNAGHAIVSGGAVRYRFYTRWRFKANEIVRMITFSGFTYLTACFFLSDLGWILTPSHTFEDLSASKVTANVVAFVSFIGLAGYFALCRFYKKTVVIQETPFHMPSIRMATAQVFIGSADILMASFVLYFCLIPFVSLPFDVFIGVFVIAQVLGVFSQVPGGLGVFEGLFLAIIPSDANTAFLFGSLIAYRIIYYLLPLIISGVAIVFYELILKYHRRRILEEPVEGEK